MNITTLSTERQKKLFNQGLLFNIHGQYLSKDSKTVFLGIPKNASSFIGELLHKNDWNIMLNDENKFINECTMDGFNPNSVNESIIILNDPIKRWISGISQYASSIMTQHAVNDTIVIIDKNLLDMMFDVIDVDDHTLPQHYYLDGLYPNTDKKYFWVNEQLEYNIMKYLELGTTIAYSHHDDSEIFRNKFKRAIISEMDANPSLYEKIKEYYKLDYELINLVDIQY